MSARREVPGPLPYDEGAEAALVGGVLVFPDQSDEALDALAPADFYVQRHGVLWQVARELRQEGVHPDAVLMTDRVRGRTPGITGADVVALMADALRPDCHHVEIVRRLAATRRLLGLLAETKAAASEPGADPHALAATLAREGDLMALTAGRRAPEGLTVPELVAQAQDGAPWVVDGMLRSDWRAIVVASEGVGKSTLLRQIAICTAQGIHPLRHDRTEPVPVLVVDAENPLDAITETAGVLDEAARAAVGADYDPRRCIIWRRPGGLDLRDPKDRGDFVRELRAARPRLVVAGPIYKLCRRRDRESYEDAAEGVLSVLDDLRTRFGFALLLEHHAPKAQGGYRDLVPFGSQRWLAWPELGISLRAEKDGSGLRVARFRGDRLRNSWPDRLERSHPWLWKGVWRGGDP